MPSLTRIVSTGNVIRDYLTKWNGGDIGVKFGGAVGSVIGFSSVPAGIAGTGDFSVSLIYNKYSDVATAGVFPRVMTLHNAGGAGRIEFANTIIRFYTASGNYDLNYGLILNQMVHLTLVKRANFNQCQLFLNGSLYVTGATSVVLPTIICNTTGFQLGRQTASAGWFHGSIYDAKTFNRALTAEEVYQLYIKSNTIVPASALANLRMDLRLENKSGTVATDSSGFGVNGTLTNFPSTALGPTNAWVNQYGNPILAY